MIRLFLQCEPLAKQSAKFNKSGIAYTPAKLKKYVKDLKLQIQAQFNEKLTEKPVHIKRLHFYFSCTKTMIKNKKICGQIGAGFVIPKTTKPDIDNCMKPLFDSMEGIVFKNDSQIWAIDEIRKYYRHNSGILIELEF